MFYGTDENGHIVESYDNSVLPSEYQDIFPQNISDLQEIPFEQETFLSVSGNDVVSSSGIVSDPYYSVSQGFDIDYDELAQVLANVPAYNVYPNVSAVEVFCRVLNGELIHISAPPSPS